MNRVRGHPFSTYARGGGIQIRTKTYGVGGGGGGGGSSQKSIKVPFPLVYVRVVCEQRFVIAHW